MTLTEFLLARIADDEAVACAASEGQRWTWDGEDLMSDHEGEMYPWGTRARECIIATEGANPPNPETAGAHIARHDPARVLAECEAKRRIVEWHDDEHVCEDRGHDKTDPDDRHETMWHGYGCHTLRLLALPYAGHPDYDEAW